MNGHICCEHWIDGLRRNTSHLPEIIVPPTQLLKLKNKLKAAKERLKQDSSSSKVKSTIKTLKKKLIAASSANTNSISTGKTSRRKIVKRSPKKRRRPSAETTDSNKTSCSCAAELNELKQQLKEKSRKLLELENKLLHTEGQLLHTQHMLDLFKTQSFSFQSISKDLKTFKYLCGLDLEQFNILMDIVRPYLPLLTHNVKKFSHETQYLVILTICRHGLDYRFMAFIIKTSEATVGRIANSWFVFLATLFNNIDLTPEHGFLIEKMPSSFVTTGHGKTDLVVDATEFKFNFASNLDVNTLLFSHYKNHSTGKALIGIAPMEWELCFLKFTQVQLAIQRLRKKLT